MTVFTAAHAVPPRIPGSRTDTDVAVIARRPVRLECEPTGVPDPEVTWFKDGGAVDAEGSLLVRLGKGGKMLQIVAAEPEHAGAYSCVAKNVAGQDRRRFNLAVQGESEGAERGRGQNDRGSMGKKSRLAGEHGVQKTGRGSEGRMLIN